MHTRHVHVTRAILKLGVGSKADSFGSHPKHTMTENQMSHEARELPGPLHY